MSFFRTMLSSGAVRNSLIFGRPFYVLLISTNSKTSTWLFNHFFSEKCGIFAHKNWVNLHSNSAFKTLQHFWTISRFFFLLQSTDIEIFCFLFYRKCRLFLKFFFLFITVWSTKSYSMLSIRKIVLHIKRWEWHVLCFVSLACY